MSNHDQQPDQPRAVPDQSTRRVERGYQPQAKDPAPSKPPENPPNQKPVGRQR